MMAASDPSKEETALSRVSTYLNFQGDTEEAFTFYASVFGTEFTVPISGSATCPRLRVPPSFPNTSGRR